MQVPPLWPVRNELTVVEAVRDPVIVIVGVALISLAVAVGIELLGVRHVDAVVAHVTVRVSCRCPTVRGS